MQVHTFHVSADSLRDAARNIDRAGSVHVAALDADGTLVVIKFDGDTTGLDQLAALKALLSV